MYTYGIHKQVGVIVKFPVRVTGWLHQSEWSLWDHYPTEDEYFELMKDCDYLNVR